ncbi:MAG: DUF4340 domain-containing protein [Candidatus Wallbacteria bacterium]|nr:DUF4340 domain-containing protein [Candidatus Wallbacteria bacterium]
MLILTDRTYSLNLKNRKPFAGLHPESVTKISISGRSRIDLSLRSGSWQVETIDSPADPALCNSLLKHLPNLNVLDIASANPEKAPLFGIGKQPLTLTISAGEKNLAVLEVGKSGPDYACAYFRIKGKNEVYLAGFNLTAFCSTDPNHWISKDFFRFDQDRVVRFKMVYGTDEIIVSRSQGWKTDSPHAASIDTAEVDSLFKCFSPLSCEGIATPGSYSETAEAVFTMATESLSGEETRLSLSGMTSGIHYAICSSSRHTFLLNSSKFDRIIKCWDSIRRSACK